MFDFASWRRFASLRLGRSRPLADACMPSSTGIAGRFWHGNTIVHSHSIRPGPALPVNSAIKRLVPDIL